MDEFGMTGEQNYSRTEKSAQRRRTTSADRPNTASTARRKPGATTAGAASQRRASESYGFIDFIFDRRTRSGLGVVLIVLAVVMAIVAISHLAHGAVDQSAVADRTVTEVVKQGDKVDNVGGPLGAKLSQWLMADSLGVGSFVLVIWLGILGLSLVGATRCKFWTLTFRSLFTAIAISIVVGLITYNSESYVHWGGAHGRYVNEMAITYASWLGAIALSLIMIGLLASIYLNPLIKAKKAMNEKLTAMRELRRERNERARRNSLQDMKSDDYGSDEEKPAVTPVSFDTDEPEPEQESASRRDDIVEEEEPMQKGLAPVPMPEEDHGLRPLSFADNGTDSDDVNFSALASLTSAEDENSLSDMPDAGFSIDTEPDFKIEAADTIEQASEAIAPGEHSGIEADYDPRADLSRFNMPVVELLTERDCGPVVDEKEQEENKEMIVNTLKSYNISIAKISATVGPTVTLYEIVPAEGVRIAQIKNLEDDIALSLAALGIRIIAPIPGKGTVGIEVPNREPRTVSIRSVLGSKKFHECNMKLPMAMGTTINNDVYIRDLADMPHLLVAGGSGQGKSVGLNTIIASLLYHRHPAELKLVLIDPKMVEFSRYTHLQNHYLAKIPGAEDPVVTDPMEAAATLSSLCIEMDNRYRLLREAGVVKVEEYNNKFVHRQLNPENGHRYMPYIVIIVDEFADLIMTAGKEISTSIARIAQKARAVGMHMIISTQRPSTDVITGMIKANFLGRIAFRVQQMVDSKTILDRPGANQLIGRGDMLFSHNGKLDRVQCAFIDTDEVERLTTFIDNQIGYPGPYLLPEPPSESNLDVAIGDPSQRDPLFADCARYIVTQSTASTSSLQRRFSIGYNKAGKIMDQLEAAGIVGASQGQKPRAVLVDSVTLESILGS